jgi:hypothetical protein
MRLSSTAIFASGILFAASACALAQVPPHADAKKPFAFTPAKEGKVWSAVVLATKAEKGTKPAPLPSELAPFAAQLTKFLGYDQFKLIGSATKEMKGEKDHWLVPTKNFWMSVQATRLRAGYGVELEFFQDQRSLLKNKSVLGPGSPIFVAGPSNARGQVILVLEVKP